MYAIKRLIWALLFGWTIIVGASLTWNIYQNDRQARALAMREAQAIFNKDQGFRLWGTRHGGVYVPITKETQPSPYMAHIPERDITTPSGVKLTLLNPAYMVRQLMEDFDKYYGIRGHITGLKLLRPQNAPDPWEVKALHLLSDNRDLEEVTDITSIEGTPYVRLLRPMYMESGCDKCHGHLGFKDGDFRGGVSVAVPLVPFLEQRNEQNLVLGASHGAIWILGLLSIYGGGRRFLRSFSETRRAEAEVHRLNRDLEKRVAERTRELTEKSLLLHTTISNAADGIIVIDVKGIIETFNAAATRMFGYEEHECLGKPITMLMAEPNVSMHNVYIDNHMKTGHTHIIGNGREVEARRKDGTLFPLYLAVSKLELEDRVLFSGICRDLTDDKKIHKDLINAMAQADRANQAKTEFLASMSHELRTPLNGIIGFSQLLQYSPNEPLTDNQTTYAGLITESGQHLLSLINDILDLTRIETEGFSMSIEAIDPKAASNSALTLIGPVAHKHAIPLIRNGFEDDLPMVLGDEVRTKQVLMNLLSNAVKYNTKGGTVTLSLEPLGNRVRFSVTDTGPGILEDQVDDLFEPFNRLGQEAGNIEGSGIGLTITRKLVLRMNGDMGVETKLGHGSTFWFELPVSDQPSAKVASEQARKVLMSEPPDGNYRILYVEDNPRNRTLMAELLKPYESLEYISATSGEDGVMLANDLCPDLILMDIDLPGIDGFEALKRLKQSSKLSHIPVIAISANALPRDVKKASQAQFVDYLTKPIDVKRTLDSIFKALLKTKKSQT